MSTKQERMELEQLYRRLLTSQGCGVDYATCTDMVFPTQLEGSQPAVFTRDEKRAAWCRAVGYAIGELLANYYETPKAERASAADVTADTAELFGELVQDQV